MPICQLHFDSNRRRAAPRSLGATDNSSCPTIRSSRSSKATAPGRDIWRASVRVFDAAVEKAYGGKRKIAWMEVYAGEKSFKQFNNWLPDETVEAFREYLVGIKGPLTTPVGGGIRSLNVALRQMLDLYVCLRPVRWFKGVPSPVKHPGEGGHGDLPREHGRHLRRHRVRRRHARGAEGPRLLREGVPEGIQEDPLRHASGAARTWQTQLEAIGAPKRERRRRGRHRHQADQLPRAPSASCTARSATRCKTSARASRSCTRATS